jgi:signal transduction histidine kinase
MDGIFNVLLIEDNEEHVRMLRHMFLQGDTAHYNLIHFNRLGPALDRARLPGIHVILLDLTLPDSNGIDTFLRMESAAANVPIVVLSGLNDESLAMETVQHGAQDYLVKGRVDHHTLLRSLRYAVERKRAEQELKRAHDELEHRVLQRTGELVGANEKLLLEIKERKRAEDALRASNRQLAEALEKLRETQEHIIQRERLHALGRMASGIAHDFNNALAPILGFSELMLLRPETLQDSAKTKNYLEMIHTAAEDSSKIVSRLREFYRYREDTEIFAPVSLNDLIQQVIALTQPRWKDQAQAAGTQIKIRTDLQNIPTVAGNESELREMLFNVVFNAIDAIQEQGTISFHTFIRGECAVLQITDTGAGMTPEVRSRCLEPFYSTKAEHGTGLGLGIVYGIVRRHDGTIEIESAPNRGTTITISVPLYKEEAQPEKTPSAEPAARPLRILVVEDEPLVREVISVYLSEDNHEIETAKNGREGLEKFKGGTFDLVLTDRAMPEMNGDILASEIKKIAPRQPVVLLTGFGDLMSGAGERPAGVDLVVSKPFTLNTLRDAITKGMQKNAS